MKATLRGLRGAFESWIDWVIRQLLQKLSYFPAWHTHTLPGGRTHLSIKPWAESGSGARLGQLSACAPCCPLVPSRYRTESVFVCGINILYGQLQSLPPSNRSASIGLRLIESVIRPFSRHNGHTLTCLQSFLSSVASTDVSLCSAIQFIPANRHLARSDPPHTLDDHSASKLSAMNY